MSNNNVETKSPKKNDVLHIGFPKFERILVAYDGIELSKTALSYAAYFSKVSDSDIVLINVVRNNRDLKKVLPITITPNIEEKEEEQLQIIGGKQEALLNKSLRELVEEMTMACKAAGLTNKITYEIRAGDPADEIIRMFAIVHFDLIIMGSRKIASKIEVIGSTTRRVLTKVKTPILIVQKQPTYKDEY